MHGGPARTPAWGRAAGHRHHRKEQDPFGALMMGTPPEGRHQGRHVIYFSLPEILFFRSSTSEMSSWRLSCGAGAGGKRGGSGEGG